MRHLRWFNESFDIKEGLQDFCETNLAYLLDDGLIIEIDNYGRYLRDVYEVRILFHEKFTWNMCKDHVIPFLDRLIQKYELDIFYDSQKSIRKDNKGATSAFLLGTLASFFFCGRHEENLSLFAGHISEDIKVGLGDIKDIDQIIKHNFIMDEILFFVKGEK